MSSKNRKRPGVTFQEDTAGPTTKKACTGGAQEDVAVATTTAAASSPSTARQDAAATTNNKQDIPPWSLEMHRDFVQAIYTVGMKNCSPSVIMDYMPKAGEITTERIKSHLQKYRRAKDKSQEEFMDSYTSWLDRVQRAPPWLVLDMVRQGKLSSGEPAAFLTYMALNENTHKTKSTRNSQQETTTKPAFGNGMDDLTFLINQGKSGEPFQVPTISSRETQTPIGESMVYVTGLLHSMSNHIQQERLRKARQKEATNKKETTESSNTTRTTTPAVTTSTNDTSSGSCPKTLPSQQQTTT